MSQAKTAFVLLVVFFAGCAASRIMVPSAHATATPQRWEYLCRNLKGEAEVAKGANEAGQQGWELAAAGLYEPTQGATWCFKRPLP
jgi:hypothetical protein